jgi:hypothetical protein
VDSLLNGKIYFGQTLGKALLNTTLFVFFLDLAEKTGYLLEMVIPIIGHKNYSC